MSNNKNFFATTVGIIIVGGLIGLIASLLQKLGNPANMGVCIVCMGRDIAGALGLHRAAAVQYMRPEILGIILGAFMSAFAFKEFKARIGSSSLIRFILCFFGTVGALIFLGCPWRTLIRLGGGDLNAIAGFIGMVAGISVAVIFFKKNYEVAPSKPTNFLNGLILPAVMLFFLSLIIIYPQVAGMDKNGVLFYSLKGPGSMHAPVVLSLIGGLTIGALAQRSRFCTIGAFTNLIMFKQLHLFFGVMALIAGSLVSNLFLGQFKLGFEGQPIAHTFQLFNFGGMFLAGLAFVLAGGCPARQLVLAGEGNADAGMAILGMLTGAAFSHNLEMNATPTGLGANSITALTVGIAVCIVIGFAMRTKENTGA